MFVLIKRMVRQVDTPGIHKHIRFNYPDSKSELAEILKGFPGVKAIVLHVMGKSGEHPHLHVWYEAQKPVTNETVRNHLRKYNELFTKMSGQNDWSFRNHDSFNNWADYVCHNLSHKVIMEYQDLKERSDKAKIITLNIGPETPGTVASPGPAAPVRVVKSRLTQSEKVILYCEQELHWEKNKQFTLSHYENPQLQDKMFRQINSAVTRKLRGKFNDPQAIALLRNCLYEFADDDLQEFLEQKFCHAANKFL